MQEIEFLVPNKNSFKKEIYWLVLTAIFLAFAILIEWISLSFKFYFLSFNISLFIVFFTFYLIDLKHTILLLLLKFIIVSILQPGIIVLSFLGNFVGLLFQLIFILCFALVIKLFYKRNQNQNKNPSIQKHLVILNLMFSPSFVIIQLVLILLNTFLINPIYFKVFGIIDSASYNAIKEVYLTKSLNTYFFGIKNYFWASFIFYFTFNSLNFFINIIIINLLMVLEYKTKFFTRMVSTINQHKY
ncbi:MPN527 family putative ECF transporter permease subunit [Mycoplasma hafezii]|uniref:MPN527 family putative ECF transporter permease subunit n=1 Tax=Mycoplasma hafezii TaxID=525886 RepID=UPI003CF06EF8